MEWMGQYSKVTLFFWRDEEKVTAKQFAAISVIFSGLFYINFVKLAGGEKPAVDLAKYALLLFSIYVIAFYIFGRRSALFSQAVLKYMRLNILHLTLTVLFFISFVSIHLLNKNLNRLIVASILTSILIGVYTMRAHPVGLMTDKQGVSFPKYQYYLILVAIALLMSMFSGVFSYFFVLPKQW